jgi:hypothetical protein
MQNSWGPWGKVMLQWMMGNRQCQWAQRGSKVQQWIHLRQTNDESDLLKVNVVQNSWGPWEK